MDEWTNLIIILVDRTFISSLVFHPNLTSWKL